MAGLFSYEGKRVVLTGGATGVGAAAIELLADAGCTDLTVLDIKEPTGPATRFIPTDMSDPASIDAAVADIAAAGGGSGVDVLFNNAGVAGVHPNDFVIRVNNLGVPIATRPSKRSIVFCRRIYALIRNTGSSSDGRVKGITAPDPIGQARSPAC